MSIAGELLEADQDQNHSEENYGFEPAEDHGNERHRLINPNTYEQVFVRDNQLMYRNSQFGPAEETSWDELMDKDGFSQYLQAD